MRMFAGTPADKATGSAELLTVDTGLGPLLRAHEQTHWHTTVNRYREFMTMPHREMFRSTLILGSGALITSTIGVIRLKAVAILIGPAGLGAVALLLNVVAV